MNENEITRIVADAFRDAYRRNTDALTDEAEKDAVTNVLYDAALAIADEVWPNKSEESPQIPEEWERAVVGE